VARFRNPANGYEEPVGTPWIWCVLFSCVYFAAKDISTHAVAALLLAFLTIGFSWFVYPFLLGASLKLIICVGCGYQFIDNLPSISKTSVRFTLLRHL
jgi:hypothetical protein